MLDWDDVQYFLAVYRAGTLLGASRALKVEHSTVGRRITAMEKELRAKLFVRTPDGFQPTKLGASIVTLAENAETSMLQIERLALADDDRAEGTVRVTTSEAFARVLGQWLAELREKHPRITVELHASNRPVDLTRREADLAVRFAPTRERNLVCRRVARVAWAPYAARTYVDKHGALPASGSLAGHDVIAFHDTLQAVPGARYLAEGSSGANIVLRSASIPAAVHAAVAGLGVAIVPCFMAASEPALVRLGPSVGAPDGFLVVHPDLARVARVRVVMAFLVERFAAFAGMLSGETAAAAAPPAPALRAKSGRRARPRPRA